MKIFYNEGRCKYRVIAGKCELTYKYCEFDQYNSDECDDFVEEE